MTKPTSDELTWSYPYQPEPRQKLLHACTSDEVLYGGAAGGGKTDAMLASGVALCLAVPGAKVLLLRRTFPELEQEIIPRLLERLPGHVARYRDAAHTFRFTNGSVFRLGYLQHRDDIYKYSGAEYQLIIWDELTQFDRAQFVFLRTRVRAAGKVARRMRALGVRPRMIGSTNPGGRGHGWVKRMFIDPAPWEQEFHGDDGLTRTYIPAKATDNRYLDLPQYLKQLNSLDPVMRRAMMDGDWDILAGVRFPQFRRSLHVVPPSALPLPQVGYPRAMGVDYGQSAPFAALWGCLIPASKTVVVYRELYRTELTATQQAALIAASEAPGERLPSRPIPIALDPACWARSSEQMAKGLGDAAPVGSIAYYYQLQFGGAVRKARNDRVSGWALVDQALVVQDSGLPRLLIYDTCPELIRTIAEQMRDRLNPEDVDTKGEDHLPDALRYLLYELVGGGNLRVGEEPDRDPLRTVTGHLATVRF